MDPIRNPYAPGAGQRPPELAGRSAQLAAFDVVLERVAHGRPERSIVLTGLRGVGKTVLLNALRSAAVRRGWGTGKLEARPDQGLRRPLSSALHQAVRELGHPDEDSVTHVLGVVRSFAERDAGAERQAPGPVAPRHRRAGGPRPRRLRRHRDRPGRAVHRPRRARRRPGSRASRSSSTRCRTSAPTTSPRSAPPATRSASRGCRVIVVGAGLPHLPAVLSAAKSYSERLFGYQRIDRLDRENADLALRVPAEAEEAAYDDGRAGRAVRRHRRLPLLHPGLRQDGLGPRPALADHRRRRRGRRARGRARAGRRLLRLPLRARDAGGAGVPARHGRCRSHCEPRCSTTSSRCRPPTSPRVLGKKPQSLSPARDALLKKGLIYSGERGRIAFTVPHFGAFLRSR